MIFTHLRLLFSIIGSVLLYYFDVLSDIAVLGNYYGANENGFFGITSFAIFSSLLAQILYSPLLSIYRNDNQNISTPSCIFRLLLSTLYLTPLYLLYKFLKLQCCRLAKGSRDELQLAKISNGGNNNGLMNNIINDIEQQKQDPNMIDNLAFLDSGILTEKHKKYLLSSMLDDMIRYSFIKSCFQSSICIFVQIFVLGEYFLFKDKTRSNNHDKISLSGNDVLLFPDDTNEVYLLIISTTISFICLCTASWSQISDLVKQSPQSELNWCIPLLFRLRAILESSIRVLRFMTVSVVFGAIYGVLLIITEIIWKYIILSCCDTKRRKRRKKRKQKKKKRKSGYSGSTHNNNKNDNGIGGGNSYSQMNDETTRKCGDCCECDIELYKGVASWMLFARERFKNNPCLMRFTDIVLWTVLLLSATSITIQVSNTGKLHGVCNKFLAFQNDCLPLEVIIAITVIIVLLLIIYISSPSIFNLVSALDQDIFENRKQKLLKNGGKRDGTMILNVNGNDDEYESEEDDETQITVIDISQPVENPTMPKKPKRKYSNSNNLMMMSIDDDPEYDYQQSNQ